MADDRRLKISSSRMHPDDVARHTFGTSRRGFDPAEVRAYLEMVSAEFLVALERERELRELVAEAEHRAANPVLDEATLTAALGQETARVLRSAHDAAAEVTGRAEAEAEQLRAGALAEAGALRERADQIATERTEQVEAATAELKRRAHEEATGAVEKARLEAEALLSQARAECRAMVQEAQDLRAKVLADLTRRRRVLHSQIEQLRAGRERLAETITGVRNSVDVIADELFRAEDEARLAAEEAGRQLAVQAEAAETDVVEPVAEPAADAGVDTAAGTAGDATQATEGTGAPGSDGPSLGADDEESRKQAVEDLFARLRAGAGTTAVATAGAVSEPVAGTEAAPAGAGEADIAAAAEPEAEVGAGAGDEVEADPDLARRDELLRPVITGLTRRLKRALQDDQNDILDRLRAAGGWGPKVLPPVKEHRARYVGAATEHLREAASSGALFAGGTPADAPAVDAICDELAATIVAPLRRRLDGDAAGSESGDDALVDRVGAAFREWKGARVERLAGDQALAAFGQATLAVVPKGTTLRWVVDDGGVECPDCDDNALSGPTPPGEAFPTGHPHPPAHAGCRCLIAPVTT
jgi:DivIVA domain-containing protein